MPNGKPTKPEIGAEIEMPPWVEKPEIKPEIKAAEPEEEEAVEIPEAEEIAPSAPPPAPPVRVKDETTQAIEKILEQDLGDVYVKLDPATKEKFRVQGDILVSRIWNMMQTLKLKTRQVLKWIREWLRIIPGVNKYFLEQEAKIKTDKIAALAEEEKKKRQGLI